MQIESIVIDVTDGPDPDAEYRFFDMEVRRASVRNIAARSFSQSSQTKGFSSELVTDR